MHITTALGTRRSHTGNVRQTRSRVMTVKAETSVSPAADEAYPDCLTGKLIGMTPEQFREIAFGKDVEVRFGGKRYRFSRLEQDGSFELRKVF